MRQFSFTLIFLTCLLMFVPPAAAQMDLQQQAQQRAQQQQMLMQQQRVQQQQLEQQRLQQQQLQEQMLRQERMLKQQQQEREKQQSLELHRSIQSHQAPESRQTVAPAQKVPATSNVNDLNRRQMQRRNSYGLTEKTEISGKPLEGVFGMFGGRVLFVEDGKPKFASAFLSQPQHKFGITSKGTLTADKHEIKFDFKYDGGDIGMCGIGMIFADDKVIPGRIEQTGQSQYGANETWARFTILLDENRLIWNDRPELEKHTATRTVAAE